MDDERGRRRKPPLAHVQSKSNWAAVLAHPLLRTSVKPISELLINWISMICLLSLTMMSMLASPAVGALAPASVLSVCARRSRLIELHSDPQIMRYLSADGRPWPHEIIVEKLADFIAERAARGHTKWKVCLHHGTFIGRAGLREASTLDPWALFYWGA